MNISYAPIFMRAINASHIFCIPVISAQAPSSRIPTSRLPPSPGSTGFLSTAFSTIFPRKRSSRWVTGTSRSCLPPAWLRFLIPSDSFQISRIELSPDFPKVRTSLRRDICAFEHGHFGRSYRQGAGVCFQTVKAPLNLRTSVRFFPELTSSSCWQLSFYFRPS